MLLFFGFQVHECFGLVNLLSLIVPGQSFIFIVVAASLHYYSMASVRVQLKELLKIDGLDQQLREAMALLDRLAMEKKPLAVAYNLIADLFMEQSLLLEDPVRSRNSISDGLIYYEKAAELAPNCLETAAAHGGALIALQLLDSAEVVLQRGIAIRDVDSVHPFVNHIGIRPDAGTKDQLIADARLRMKKDLAYIKARRQGSLFNKVLMQLDNSRAQCSTILNAAKDITEKQPDYVHAKLLYPHVVLCMLRSGLLMSNQLTDEKRESILQSALKGVLDLVADFPKSLVISLCCANLHIAVGFFDAAEREFRRALGIVSPDDPRDHEIPFGCTKGVQYMDRVLDTTLDTIFGLGSIFHMFESTFGCLIEESKGSFLSVKVNTLLESSPEMSSIIHEAIDYYKTNNSWVLWRCFWKDDESCLDFFASTPEELIRHVLQHAVLDDNMLLHSTILEKLSKHTLNDDLHCCLDLGKDEEGHDVLCIKSLDDLFKAIFNAFTGSLMESTDPNPKLGAYLDRLHTTDSKVYICSLIFIALVVYYYGVTTLIVNILSLQDAIDIMEKAKRIVDVLSGIKIETISPNSSLSYLLLIFRFIFVHQFFWLCLLLPCLCLKVLCL